MKNINFKNTKRGLCVVCGKLVITSNPPLMECTKCHHICKSSDLELLDKPGPKIVIIDVKSDCCNADVRFSGVITCSPVCHEVFVVAAEMEFGKFKKVVDSTTNNAYKVPIRDIIEYGLTFADLPKYPVWE